ncbi:PEPxxWA-CTERM sorting domain-containing protein [Sphingomonas sp.]|uniref:PEPxxWA-CTERM sorting domain-containing protein n=1 Tax=Sphingomonas sp. TaxID=28214 RepID=UPI000DB661FF|nr:PEPxxWA-CTERM sorting domain-containing protein [Sphingomonas sp.]PZU06109.1 MAG: PEP-CTERM sorting domain-containing protein [Sphingomonas sp.]
MKYLAFVFVSVALSAGFVAAPAPAVVTTLTFSGNICGAAGNEACGNYSQIGANYGDSATVDVQYRSIATSSGATYEPFLKYWSQYGDLPGIVWGGNSMTGYASEINILPAAGYEVSLIGFDFATYLNRSATVPFAITALDGTSIYSGTQGTSSPTHASLALNSDYFAQGIRLTWGPDGYDVGLDNIAFDVREASAAPVPEPATWAMMVGGFGLIGSALRRRKAVTMRFA